MTNTYQNEPEMRKEVNPWKTIWYAPRAAIRSVIDYKPMMFAIVLAILVGVTNILDRAIGKNLGEQMATPVVWLLILIGGTISGIVSWIVFSGIMTVIGKMFGGTAKFKEMAMAIGAAYIPSALTVIIYLLDVIFLGQKLFIEADITMFQITWLLLSSFMTIILSFWTIFLMIKAIAEAHHFSSWKGFFTLIIPTVLLTIVLVIIGFLFVFLT